MKSVPNYFEPITEAFLNIWNKDDTIALSSAQTLSQFIGTIPLYRIPELDDAFRSAWPHNLGNVLNAREMEIMRAFPDSFVALASYSYGYWREAAVKELMRYGSRVAQPFILYRCLDWVESIRSLAEDDILAKTPILPTRSFAAGCHSSSE